MLVGSIAAGVLVVGVQPAGASPILVNCVGANYQFFQPGLTNTPQQVTLSGEDRATHCVSLTNPDRRSFVGPFSGTSVLSCTSLFQGGEGSERLYWNGSHHPSETSVWEYEISFQNVNGNNIGTAIGPIVSGPLKGATLTQTITVPQTNLLACFTPEGMTANTGPSTWTFTKL